ncbi:Zn-ribbon domain-containing OB-fold protein [Rhodococcus olei]|uniref:Zn-ribbon domain-containing OB-fold protein n=1 Tax=Rhodococcus olei TaxID=2161675 RepID=UPI0031E82FA8
MSARSAAERLLPTVVDRASRGFFDEAAQGRLSLLTCTSCGKRIHLPRPRCVYCGAADPVWKPVARTGTIYAHTVVEHQVHPNFPVPYTVVVVDVDGEEAGVRLIGNLPGRAEVSAGTPVVCAFEDLGQDAQGNPVVLPVWRVAPQRAGTAALDGGAAA